LTALDYAKAGKNQDLIRILLKAGAREGTDSSP
jgi:hypothetical protein